VQNVICFAKEKTEGEVLRGVFGPDRDRKGQAGRETRIMINFIGCALH
jgi:hypothetical protein